MTDLQKYENLKKQLEVAKKSGNRTHIEMYKKALKSAEKFWK